MADLNIPDWMKAAGLILAPVAERLYRVIKSRDKLARKLEEVRGELTESMAGVYRRLGRLEQRVITGNTPSPYEPEPVSKVGKPPKVGP